MSNRDYDYQNVSTFVSPGARPAQPPTITTDGAIASQDIGAVFAPAIGITEKTSARDRAIGLCIRSLPLAVLGVVFGLAVLLVVRLVASVAVAEQALSVLLTLATVYGTGFVFLHRQELQHSSAGVERHRLNVARDIHAKQVDAELQLRREALAAQIKMLEGGDNSGNQY